MHCWQLFATNVLKKPRPIAVVICLFVFSAIIIVKAAEILLNCILKLHPLTLVCTAADSAIHNYYCSVVFWCQNSFCCCCWQALLVSRGPFELATNCMCQNHKIMLCNAIKRRHILGKAAYCTPVVQFQSLTIFVLAFLYLQLNSTKQCFVQFCLLVFNCMSFMLCGLIDLRDFFKMPFVNSFVFCF